METAPFMQNMHEQSPIALLCFFYCDLAVLIDPFLELAGFGILLDDLIDDLHEIVITHLHATAETSLLLRTVHLQERGHH